MIKKFFDDIHELSNDLFRGHDIFHLDKLDWLLITILVSCTFVLLYCITHLNEFGRWISATLK